MDIPDVYRISSEHPDRLSEFRRKSKMIYDICECLENLGCWSMFADVRQTSKNFSEFAEFFLTRAIFVNLFSVYGALPEYKLLTGYEQ